MQDAHSIEYSCMDSRHPVSHGVFRGVGGHEDAVAIVWMDGCPVDYA